MKDIFKKTTSYILDTSDCNDDPFQIITKININILGMNNDESNIENRILQLIQKYTSTNKNHTNLEIYNKFIKYALLLIFCVSKDEEHFHKITPPIAEIILEIQVRWATSPCSTKSACHGPLKRTALGWSGCLQNTGLAYRYLSPKEFLQA